MLGVEPFEKRGQQLTRYLSKTTHPELQQGAVSALADVQSPHASTALLDALPNLTDSNRNLALDALLRDTARASALLDAIERKQLDPKLLGDAQITRLKTHNNENIRTRAANL
jgi:HEAT repeat protein